MDFSSLTLGYLESRIVAEDAARDRRPCPDQEFLKRVRALEHAVDEFMDGKGDWPYRKWMSLLVQWDQAVGRRKPEGLDALDEETRRQAWLMQHRREAAYERALVIDSAIDMMQSPRHSLPTNAVAVYGDSLEITRRFYVAYAIERLGGMDYPFDWNPW